MINKNIFQLVLNLIYPPVCGVCGKINNEFLCKKCYNNLKNQSKFITEKIEEKNFQNHLYVFKYEGTIRKLLIEYKFNDKAYLYKTFSNFLLKDEKFFNILKSYDTIMPVPVSKKRRKMRGYNQCELIAKEFAKNAGIDYQNRCLLKIKNNIEQNKLNKEERENNIKNVYKIVNCNEIKNKKILLVDDIYTTGNTVNECCRVIKMAEVKQLDVFTIAKD